MTDTVSGEAAVKPAFIAHESGLEAGRAEAAEPTIREAVWTVDNGAVRISYPYPMVSDDVDDIEAYLALWLRGLRRAAAAKAQPAQTAVGSASLTRDA